MARVLNKYKIKQGDKGIYIGRPGPFRNDFRMELPEQRDEVCDAHILFVLGNPELIQRVRRELPGKNLICFCAPKRCHGDFLIRLANEPHDPLCIARDLIFYPGRTASVSMKVFEVFDTYMRVHGDHQQTYLAAKHAATQYNVPLPH